MLLKLSSTPLKEGKKDHTLNLMSCRKTIMGSDELSKRPILAHDDFLLLSSF
jgi:hypothetical protein